MTATSSEASPQATESADQPRRDDIRLSWELGLATLVDHFKRNRSQMKRIFWLSVFVMAVGCGMSIWGIYQFIQYPHTLKPTSITAIEMAVITTLAGVVTEFIGATFMLIYWSVIKQTVNYTHTLERLNSVGMAIQILNTIPDETKADDLKNKTKATIVELLIRQSYKIPEGSDDKDSVEAE